LDIQPIHERIKSVERFGIVNPTQRNNGVNNTVFVYAKYVHRN